MQKSKDLDRIHKSYVGLLTSLNNHNIELAESSIDVINELQTGFWERVSEYIEQATSSVCQLKTLYTDNPDYTEKLYNALDSKGIFPDKQGNNIQIGPIDIYNEYRKKEKTHY